MSQPIPSDYLSVDCWTMLSRPSAAGMRTGQPVGVGVRALVQRRCKTKGSGWCGNATSQKINKTIRSVLVFLLLEKSCGPCWVLKHWFIPDLVKITLTRSSLSELLTAVALCLLNATEWVYTMTWDSTGHVGGADSGSKAGKWRRGFAGIVWGGKRRGLDKSLILQRKEKR